MNIIEAIRMRKSIRDFKPDPVSKTILSQILEIASRAPSAENSQPWEFTIIAGDVLDNIRQANIEKLNAGAPSHPDLNSKGWPPRSVYRRRQIEIANQGITYPEVLHKLAGIPESKRTIISIAMGYPNRDFPANKLVSYREPLENITTWCGFDKKKSV